MKDINEQLKDIFEDYSTDVRKTVNECCLDVARESGLKLRETSPKDTGKYAKSWAVKEVKTNDFGGSTWVVYNKKYQLTHLLEKGHAKRNGGRVKAYPHIKPVEEWAINELPKEIIDKLGG